MRPSDRSPRIRTGLLLRQNAASPSVLRPAGLKQSGRRCAHTGQGGDAMQECGPSVGDRTGDRHRLPTDLRCSISFVADRPRKVQELDGSRSPECARKPRRLTINAEERLPHQLIPSPAPRQQNLPFLDGKYSWGKLGSMQVSDHKKQLRADNPASIVCRLRRLLPSVACCDLR